MSPASHPFRAGSPNSIYSSAHTTPAPARTSVELASPTPWISARALRANAWPVNNPALALPAVEQRRSQAIPFGNALACLSAMYQLIHPFVPPPQALGQTGH